MSIILISVLVGLGLGIFFILLSFFSKKEDYLLDDYTEDDKPDNVRIIEKEIHKVIEKEVIKEVEKIVIDTKKITELEEKIESIENSKNDLNKSLKSSNDNLDISENKLSKLENKLEEYKVGKDLIESDFDLYKREMSEKFNLVIEEKENIKKTKDKDYNILTQSIKDQQKDNNKSILKLQEEKTQLLEKSKKIEKNRKDYQKLFKDTKKELDVQKKEVKSIIGDRNHFSNLIDKRDKEISKIKIQLDTELKKHQDIFEGIDNYGKFYDINNLNGKISKEHISKILQASEELNSNQFAYYAINTLNGYENIKIHDIKQLDEFLSIVNNKEYIIGKYKIYIILGTKVYRYEIY